MSAIRPADRLGGTRGNEQLTSMVAVLLTVLLAGEGVTILRLEGLLTEHMLIGLALIPPVLLKLSSTGYRFVRYYSGASPYRAKGPPLLPLRLLAPVLVVTTLAVFSSGTALLLAGHRGGWLLLVHKVSFVVWGGCFAAHLLAHAPRAWRALTPARSAPRSARPAGTRLRTLVLGVSLGAGLGLALSLLPLINRWPGQ